MLVGLYSELARQGIVAARRLIADRGYRPSPQDIRHCREEVMAADDGSLLKLVIQWNDFFAMNECRDLIFHVQEQHTTLREIRLFLAAADVQFGGFMLDALTLQRFATRFPGPATMTNLECWQTFNVDAKASGAINSSPPRARCGHATRSRQSTVRSMALSRLDDLNQTRCSRRRRPYCGPGRGAILELHSA
jgi:hypothetical protein